MLQLNLSYNLDVQESSAYKNNSDALLQLSTKSLIKIINNKGPKIEPCGIPLRTSSRKRNH